MAPPKPVFEITLRSTDGFDPFNERAFTLNLDESILIGRASRNATKKQLMSARDNAYIDSPVISREHALLSANANTGTPQVYLTDSASMHGTTVNGERLEPNKPHQLNNGDELQFGINVTRNESFFKAQNYTYESRSSPQQADNTFSHGFSVPEGDTSEEEEVGMKSSPRPACYGSQYNPVTIDDSDEITPAKATSITPTDDATVNVEEPLIELGPTITSDATHERSGSPQHMNPITWSDMNEHGTPAATSQAQSRFFQDQSASEDDDQSVFTSEDDDIISEGGSMMDSEIDYPSGSEASDAEDDEDTEDAEIAEDAEDAQDAEAADSVRRIKMEAMLNHEHEKSAVEIKSSMTASLPPMQTEPTFASPSAVQTPNRHEPSPLMFGPGASSNKSSSNNLDHGVHGLEMDPTTFFSNPWGEHTFVGVGMPPRSATPKPAAWTPELSSPYSTVPREPHSLRWFRDDPSTSHMFLTGQPDYRSNALHQPVEPASFNLVRSKPYTPEFAPAHLVGSSEPTYVDEGLNSEAAPGVQTPPPMPVSDVVSYTPPPPNRRTKVSIGEIVEDPPQPPTPTSVTSLKRKADVLEEDDIQESVVDTPTSSTNAEMPTETSVTEVAGAPSEQRPRKRLRAIGHAAKKAATYLAPAALTYLFFSAQSVDGFFDGRIA